MACLPYWAARPGSAPDEAHVTPSRQLVWSVKIIGLSVCLSVCLCAVSLKAKLTRFYLLKLAANMRGDQLLEM